MVSKTVFVGIPRLEAPHVGVVVTIKIDCPMA